VIELAKALIRPLPPAAAVWALVALGGCAPPPEEDPDAAVPPGPHPVWSDPANGDTDVLIDKVIRVGMSDHLDGRSVRRNRFKLYSGPLAMWVMVQYDPVRQRLSVWPSVSMWKNTTWGLELLDGLAGLDGSPVTPVVVTEFRTGAASGDNQPFPFLNYEEHVKPVFDARCASCHGGTGPVADLDLASADGIGDTALGVSSTGWPEWKRITASRPGESYLLYKIIGDERIVGAPMPRSWDESAPATPLPLEDQQAVADWIASGTAFFDPQADDQ
jgi:hypothetical protein